MIRELSRTPDRVIFGEGAEAQTADLLVELGAQRVLLIAQDRYAEGAGRVASALGQRAVGLFTTDRPQVPGEVADAAVASAREVEADWVLAHGGGTPIGVAKAVALELPVAVGAVPTTYAGSERTNIWGVTRDGDKRTGRDERVRPKLVVYDPLLTADLPRKMSLQSLFNALAHSLEALYDPRASADATRAAADSLAPLIAGVRAIAESARDRRGRAEALYGAYLAATSLDGAQMALHHKLAHVLGGSFGTPHAPTHCVLLPYTYGFNAPAAGPSLQTVKAAWGTDDPPAFLYDLQREVGLETSLASVGVTHDDVDRIVELVLARRYANPRPYDAADLRALLTDMLDDRRPSLVRT